MTKWIWVLGVMLLVAGVVRAVSIDQAMPENHAMGQGQAAPALDPEVSEIEALLGQNRTEFNAKVQLDPLRTLAVDHSDQLKILDSWARQSLFAISRKSKLNGQDPLNTALDMMWRPEVYYLQNIIYVQAVPLRLKLAPLAQGATQEEKQAESTRILKEATISPAFYARDDVQRVLKIAQETDAIMAPNVTKVRLAYFTFMQLEETFRILPQGDTTAPWVHPNAVLANFPEGVAELSKDKAPIQPVPGYGADVSRSIYVAMRELHDGWRHNDVVIANDGIAKLAAIMPTVAPHVYPSEGKRVTELWYNRTFNGTAVGALYALAWILFTICLFAEMPSLWKPAVALFAIAVVLHMAAMGVRWWLAGRIPIQNQFESVLGSAMLGCVAGLILELRTRKVFFGLAFSFVGFLAMIACFASPFVFKRDIGNSIGKVAGVLNDYWLYIHVNVVIWSYALISASFVLGSLYWLSKLWHWISPTEEVVANAAMAGGPSAGMLQIDPAYLSTERRTLLQGLDAANVVVLQLAFWLLGAGIICGAIWADHSWGRPWGWDPKETFALVTWIVYLIILHVRVAAPRNKANLTAALSVVGFGVMMFNWIGVNFFLVGLHSYA